MVAHIYTIYSCILCKCHLCLYAIMQQYAIMHSTVTYSYKANAIIPLMVAYWTENTNSMSSFTGHTFLVHSRSCVYKVAGVLSRRICRMDILPVSWPTVSKNQRTENKKAMLSQRWPHDAPYIWSGLWTPLTISGLSDYAHGYLSRYC